MTATVPWLRVERESKRKRAGIHWWCKKKKSQKGGHAWEDSKCTSRILILLAERPEHSEVERDSEGQRKGGGQSGQMKVPGLAKYVSLCYKQAIYFFMVCQM